MRFNFAINRFFARIKDSLNTKPLASFLRRQFDLPNTRHTFISFNYDLTLDGCVQRESDGRWYLQQGYGFPIRHWIEPDAGADHMKQFTGTGRSFAVLHAHDLSTPTKDCTIRILKPHGSLNFVFPFEGNYNFKDGPPIIILNEAGEIAYYSGFGLEKYVLVKRQDAGSKPRTLPRAANR
jgi:hypothetical protein